MFSQTAWKTSSAMRNARRPMGDTVAVGSDRDKFFQVSQATARRLFRIRFVSGGVKVFLRELQEDRPVDRVGVRPGVIAVRQVSRDQ